MWSSSRKNNSAFKVRDLRYLYESRWRRDSLFHIASVLGILIDDWDILVSHSCLFVTRGRIQTIIWRRNLQLEVKFDDFKTLLTKEIFNGGHDSQQYACGELKLSAPWRCVFRRNKYAGIQAGPGLYFLLFIIVVIELIAK